MSQKYLHIHSHSGLSKDERELIRGIFGTYPIQEEQHPLLPRELYAHGSDYYVFIKEESTLSEALKRLKHEAQDVIIVGVDEHEVHTQESSFLKPLEERLGVLLTAE